MDGRAGGGKVSLARYPVAAEGDGTGRSDRGAATREV